MRNHYLPSLSTPLMPMKKDEVYIPQNISVASLQPCLHAPEKVSKSKMWTDSKTLTIAAQQQRVVWKRRKMINRRGLMRNNTGEYMNRTVWSKFVKAWSHVSNSRSTKPGFYFAIIWVLNSQPLPPTLLCDDRERCIQLAGIIKGLQTKSERGECLWQTFGIYVIDKRVCGLCGLYPNIPLSEHENCKGLNVWGKEIKCIINHRKRIEKQMCFWNESDEDGQYCKTARWMGRRNHEKRFWQGSFSERNAGTYWFCERCVKSSLGTANNVMVSSKPPYIFDPDVSIAIMGLPYDNVEDLALRLWELSEEGCTCGQILPVAMQRLWARGLGKKYGCTARKMKPEIQVTVSKGLCIIGKVTHRLINRVKL